MGLMIIKATRKACFMTKTEQKGMLVTIPPATWNLHGNCLRLASLYHGEQQRQMMEQRFSKIKSETYITNRCSSVRLRSKKYTHICNQSHLWLVKHTQASVGGAWGQHNSSVDRERTLGLTCVWPGVEALRSALAVGEKETHLLTA